MYTSIIARIEINSIRNLCVERDYFTSGTVEHYCNLFDTVSRDHFILNEEGTKELLNHLEELAEIIEKYSDTADSVEDIVGGLYHKAVITYLA